MTGTASRAAARTHRLDVRPASPLTGLAALVRLFGRISRRQILIWAVAMVVTVAASVVALKEAYPDQQALDAHAALLRNPSAVLMTGPAFGRDHYNLWAAVAIAHLLYELLACAIMCITDAASVVALKEAYPNQHALDARAALLGNPSAVLMTGPAFGRDHYTLWAAVANELFLYVLLAGEIMSILLTVRHTRAEEEAGRLEMLRALPTGRLAPAAAALVVVAVANLAL